MAIEVYDMVSGGFIKSQIFTASGTWIVPATIRGDTIKVRICGGGGGGRSSIRPNTESGEAGHFIERQITFSANITVTIGAGGAINTDGGNSSLSVGASLVANGGRAGRPPSNLNEGGDQMAKFNIGFGDYGKGGRGQINTAGAEAGNDGACEIIWIQGQP
jgi:hypothetical protein